MFCFSCVVLLCFFWLGFMIKFCLCMLCLLLFSVCCCFVTLVGFCVLIVDVLGFGLKVGCLCRNGFVYGWVWLDLLCCYVHMLIIVFVFVWDFGLCV